MTAEDIIESLGPFGYWQRIIFVSLCLPDIFVSFSLLLPVFTGSTPPWSCMDGVGNMTTLVDIANGTMSPAAGTSFPDVGNSTPTIVYNNTCDCQVRRYDDGFTTIVSQWDLVCKKSFISDMITSIQMAGLLVGAGIFGQLSDLFGRKKTYFLAVILLSVSSFISAFSVNWQMYAVFRFFTGISAGGYLCINCVYPLEFVGRRWRTLCGTIGFWAIGEMVLALMAYFIRDWRHLTMATSVFGVVFVIFWWIIPDSPRWLARSGHVKEAKAVYVNIAKKNKVDIPDLSDLDRLAVKQEKAGKGKRYTYLDLFRTRLLVKITLVTVLIWFTTFVTYYETSFNLKNLSGNRYLNMFFAGFVDIFAMLSVVVFNNLIGRRISQVMYVGIAAICNIIILIFYVTHKAMMYAMGIKISALIGKASALAGTYVIQIWSAELYPTQIRNLGVGLGSVVCRAGSFLAPQIVYLGQFYEVAPYIFIVVLCTLVLPLCFLLSETNGKALQDDFDDLDTSDKDVENTHL